MSEQELFHRHPRNPILTAEDWPYAVNAVFNPGAATLDGQTILLTQVEDRAGVSHLPVARSANGIDGWSIDPQPLLAPDGGIVTEQWGFEDPRTVWISELQRFVITCTAYGPAGPAVFLATTEGLHHRRAPRGRQAASGQERRADARSDRWTLGPSPPSQDPVRRSTRRDPSVPLARLAHLEHPRASAPATRGCLVGLAAHRARPTAAAHRARLAAGLPRRQGDRCRRNLPRRPRPARPRRADTRPQTPAHLGARTAHAVRADRDVPNVVFPCGLIHDPAGDDIRLYYGAADSSVCLATARLDSVLEALLSAPAGG